MLKLKIGNNNYKREFVMFLYVSYTVNCTVYCIYADFCNNFDVCEIMFKIRHSKIR